MNEVDGAARGDRGWNASRLAGAAVLGAWAIAFWFLLVTGRDALYLSSKTAWVVPVGATLLTLAALGRLAAARGGASAPLARREAWIMAAIVAPVVLLLALPPTTLGQFSAGRRSTFTAGSGASLAGLAAADVSLVDVAVAETTDEGAAALPRWAGQSVTFIGFVTRYADTPADEFLLTRYVLTCCVADATVASVRVVNVPAGAFATDDWVQVTGLLYPVGNQVIVDATQIVPVERPDRPYLTP